MAHPAPGDFPCLVPVMNASGVECGWLCAVPAAACPGCVALQLANHEPYRQVNPHCLGAAGVERSCTCFSLASAHRQPPDTCVGTCRLPHTRAFARARAAYADSRPQPDVGSTRPRGCAAAWLPGTSLQRAGVSPKCITAAGCCSGYAAASHAGWTAVAGRCALLDHLGVSS